MNHDDELREGYEAEYKKWAEEAKNRLHESKGIDDWTPGDELKAKIAKDDARTAMTVESAASHLDTTLDALRKELKAVRGTTKVMKDIRLVSDELRRDIGNHLLEMAEHKVWMHEVMDRVEKTMLMMAAMGFEVSLEDKETED